jgi:hypothetical protein
VPTANCCLTSGKDGLASVRHAPWNAKIDRHNEASMAPWSLKIAENAPSVPAGYEDLNNAKIFAAVSRSHRTKVTGSKLKNTSAFW